MARNKTRDINLRGFFDESQSGYVPRKNKTKKRDKKSRRAHTKKRRAARHHWLLFEAKGKQFYNSKPWRALRKKVFRMYPRVCMCCGDNKSVMHVDHIQPRSRAPELSLTFDNLQVLCEDCNMEKSNIHAEDYREDATTRELDEQALLKARRLGL